MLCRAGRRRSTWRPATAIRRRARRCCEAGLTCKRAIACASPPGLGPGWQGCAGLATWRRGAPLRARRLRGSQYEITALHDAAYEGHLGCIEVLLRGGAEVLALNSARARLRFRAHSPPMRLRCPYCRLGASGLVGGSGPRIPNEEAVFLASGGFSDAGSFEAAALRRSARALSSWPSAEAFAPVPLRWLRCSRQRRRLRSAVPCGRLPMCACCPGRWCQQRWRHRSESRGA